MNETTAKRRVGGRMRRKIYSFEQPLAAPSTPKPLKTRPLSSDAVLADIRTTLEKELISCSSIRDHGGLTEYGIGRYDLVKKLLSEHFHQKEEKK